MLIASVLDGTIYATSLRIRDVVPASFWDPRDPGWRIRVVLHVAPTLTPALKSWINGAIIPILVTQYLQEVRP
jgi:hypothetical protein